MTAWDRMHLREHWKSVLVLLLFGVSAFALGKMRAEYFGTSPAQLVEVDANTLDFGDVWPNPEFEWVIPVSNVTSKPLEFTSFDSGCHCTHVRASSSHLAPGETVSLRLTINLASKTNISGEEYSPFQADVTPHILVDDRVVIGPKWSITGRIRNILKTAPIEMRFHKDLVKGVSPLAETFEFECHSPSVSLDASRFHDNFDLTVQPPAGGGTKYIFQVQPHDGLEVGDYRSVLTITPKQASGEKNLMLPSYNRIVSFSVVDQWTISPPAVSLGVVRIGEPRTVRLSLVGRPGAYGPPSTVSISFDPRFLEITADEIVESNPNQWVILADVVPHHLGFNTVPGDIVVEGIDKPISVTVTYFGKREPSS